MSFLNSVRKWVYNIISYKDIETALGLELPDNTLMEQHMQMWLEYLLNRAPYLDNANRKNKMKTMAVPSVVTKEYAKLCLLEYEASTVKESSRAKWLQKQHDKLIKPQIKIIAQWALALGNGILKPRVENNELSLDFVTYPNFTPLSWNSKGLTGVVLKTKLTKGKKIYTLFEVMQHINNVFSVDYYSFVEESGFNNSNNNIGVPVALTDVPEWANLQNFSVVTEIPWFVHIKTPALNNIDPNSVLGVSILANSADVIQSIDENYSALQWEMIAGKVRTILPKSMFSKDDDRNIINPDPEDRFYMLSESDPLKDGTAQQFAPALRNENYIETIKFNLRMIESHLSFSEGTFSTDDARPGQMTATQIMADKQETYNAVMDTNDHMIKPAIKQLIDIFNDMADKLGIPNSGSGEYDISIEMNANATVNPETRYDQALELASQYKLPWRYVLLYSQMGFTEDEAIKLIAEAGQEAPDPPPLEE